MLYNYIFHISFSPVKCLSNDCLKWPACYPPVQVPVVQGRVCSVLLFQETPGRQGSGARRQERGFRGAARGARGGRKEEQEVREVLAQEVSFSLLPGGELSEEEEEDGDLTPRYSTGSAGSCILWHPHYCC